VKKFSFKQFLSTHVHFTRKRQSAKNYPKTNSTLHNGTSQKKITTTFTTVKYTQITEFLKAQVFFFSLKSLRSYETQHESQCSREEDPRINNQRDREHPKHPKPGSNANTLNTVHFSQNPTIHLQKIFFTPAKKLRQT